MKASFYNSQGTNKGSFPALSEPVKKFPSSTGTSTQVGHDWRESTVTASTTNNYGKRQGWSNAFSKRTSATTFLPGFLRTKSKNQTMLEYINAESGNKTVVREVDLGPNGLDLKRDEPRSRKKGLLLTAIVVVMAAAIGFSMVLLLGKSSEVGDFCDGGDENARIFIASQFQSALRGTELDYEGKDIPCIPDDAFAALNIDQKLFLRELVSIRFSNNGLKKISNRAFIADELSEMPFLSVINNELTDIGDDFLAFFPTLEEVDVSNNTFKVLNSNFLRNSTVVIVGMNQNPFIEIPRSLIDCPTASDVSMIGCSEMIGFVEGMLVNTPITRINFFGTPISNLPEFQDKAVFAEAIGVDEADMFGF